jgi:tripartite-type tricarboxylate transporter receptor subunit TctC
MMEKISWRLTATAGLLVAAAVAASPARAQTGADFFKGQTVTYIVATAPGGGYDLYGRFVAEYMQKYLPGSTFVVKNVPGAGHLVGTNTIYASKPDGLTIGTFTTGLIYNQFDLTKMTWIGKASSEARVIVIAAQSPIKTFAQLREQKQPVNFAVAGIGSAAYVETVMLANLLKLPIKIQSGYSGNNDQLAMRRGEIVGTISSRTTVEQFMQNGFARFVAQIGGSEKDFPQLKDMVTEKDALALIQLIQIQNDIQRWTAGPPGIPQDRVDALRMAFRKAMEDPELQQKAIKAGRALDPAYGDEVLAMIKGALNQPPETISMLKQALEQK